MKTSNDRHTQRQDMIQEDGTRSRTSPVDSVIASMSASLSPPLPRPPAVMTLPLSGPSFPLLPVTEATTETVCRPAMSLLSRVAIVHVPWMPLLPPPSHPCTRCTAATAAQCHTKPPPLPLFYSSSPTHCCHAERHRASKRRSRRHFHGSTLMSSQCESIWLQSVLSSPSIPCRTPSLIRRLRGALRPLGYRPVCHSVWPGPSTRSPAALGQSIWRLILLSAMGVIGAAIRFRLSGSRSGLPTTRSEVNIPHWMMTLLQQTGWRAFAIGGSVVIGGAATISMILTSLTSLGWIRPQRESYTSISMAMGLSGPVWPSARHRWRKSEVQGAVMIASFVPFEESAWEYTASWLAWCARLIMRIPADTLSDRLLLRPILAAWVSGLAHSATSNTKQASVALVTLFNQLLSQLIHLAAAPLSSATSLPYAPPFSISPLVVPVLLHTLLNWLALDCYTALSPRGLEIDQHYRPLSVDGEMEIRRLFQELFYHFDPRANAIGVEIAALVGSIPGLRYLLRHRTNPIFQQPSSKQLFTWLSPPSPSPRSLSSNTLKLASRIFTLLDSRGLGEWDARSFAWFFLLAPEPLDLLRAAFVALDSQESQEEYESEMKRLEEALKREDERDAEARKRGEAVPDQSRSERRARSVIEQETQPLTDRTIHVHRTMPDGVTPVTLPFPCAAWFDTTSTPMHTEAVNGLRASLRAAGAHGFTSNDDQHDHDRDRDGRRGRGRGYRSSAAAEAARKRGWTLTYFDRLVEEVAPEALQPPIADLLNPREQQRFNRLMHRFKAYCELTCAAAFHAHLQYYGEIGMVTEKSKDDDESRNKANGDASASISNSSLIRRFTFHSFVRYLSDLALFDAPTAQSMLLQSSLILTDATTHPMHLYNIALTNFSDDIDGH